MVVVDGVAPTFYSLKTRSPRLLDDTTIKLNTCNNMHYKYLEEMLDPSWEA